MFIMLIMQHDSTQKVLFQEPFLNTRNGWIKWIPVLASQYILSKNNTRFSNSHTWCAVAKDLQASFGCNVNRH